MAKQTHPATAHLLRELTGSTSGSVASLFRGRAESTPTARFLCWDGRWKSYGEALGVAERFAGFLKDNGCVGPERRVASYLANCPEALWTWFGTQLAGSVYVPLNRGHRGALLKDMLRRSKASVLVTDLAALEELPSLRDTDVKLVVSVGSPNRPVEGCAVVGFDDCLASEPWTGVIPSPQDVGSVMYTSGSTGRSKAVLMPNNQYARGAAFVAESFGLCSDDVWHTWIPQFHISGQLYATLASVAAGGAVALYPGFSRSLFWKQVAESGSTVIGGIAHVMRLVSSVEEDEYTRTTPARLALVSGAFADLHDQFEQRFGLTIVDCYGMTEAEPVTLPVLDRLRPGCHGLVSEDFDLAILDERDQAVESGSVGEIAVRPRRPGVMFQGYEDDSEQTVQAWRNLWFHTGDLGRVDGDGFLFFLDRRKHGIRRLGENISTWEMEELLNGHPAIEMAVVIGVPTADGGDPDIKIVAVLKGGAALTASKLHEWCRTTMAKFMVPRYIELAASLPTLALGKVDRARLGSLDRNVWDAETAAAPQPEAPARAAAGNAE